MAEHVPLRTISQSAKSARLAKITPKWPILCGQSSRSAKIFQRNGRSRNISSVACGVCCCSRSLPCPCLLTRCGHHLAQNLQHQVMPLTSQYHIFSRTINTDDLYKVKWSTSANRRATMCTYNAVCRCIVIARAVRHFLPCLIHPPDVRPENFLWLIDLFT
jgi:hypothetical protein